ncbi:hypothetical protein E2562_031595 [Oryza meyeriana var. granulata]|uniref:RING-type domain-containing protein n=1 Tax=Oryza meyeriana var. granulata TaxID=110450 RepID=A0A6G1CIU4_9ORYZ|nr:hypothetical protein E2562_031595 [Oryza meyeriana var. granulata]
MDHPPPPPRDAGGCLEVRLFYVRLSPRGYSPPPRLALALHPSSCGDARGDEEEAALSLPLRLDRRDPASGEATYVCTASARLPPPAAAFEVADHRGGALLRGSLRRCPDANPDSPAWAIDCIPAAGAEAETSAFEVYVAGCCTGEPAVLTRALRLATAEEKAAGGLVRRRSPTSTDLRPLSDQHLHCLPACGHVFHALWFPLPSPPKSDFFSSSSSNRSGNGSLEQWLEYCPGGKKKLTCPICKQPCGAAHPPTRLYFQSTGACPTQACSPSRQEPDGGADPEELAAEVARLEQKAASLGKVLEEQRDGIQKLNAEASAAVPHLGGSRVGLRFDWIADGFLVILVQVAKWREKAAAAEAMRQAVRREKECVQQLLNAKTEELSSKTSECGRLQEKSLALAKELAALKLSTDMNLQEEEILELASLGNHGNPANAVDVLTRSLSLRNESYKELMIQCNVLGRSESRSQQRFEKAKELIKKLKARVQDLEKELEEKENGLIRDLRSAKKFKADQTNLGNMVANNGFSSLAGSGNHTMKLDEVIQDPCNRTGPSPVAKSDLNIKDNMDNKHADVIDLDADDSVFQDEHKIGLSAKPFGNCGINLDLQRQSGLYERDRKESITCKTSCVAEENSFLKHSMATERSTLQESLTTNKLQNFQEIPVLRSMKATTSTWEKETLTIDGISKQATRLSSGTGPQQVHNFNSLSYDFQTPVIILGGEGTRKSIGKWCKGLATPGSLNTNANKSNLIAVGPDGRGGKVKILRDLGKFQDSKSQALWPKAQKLGSKGNLNPLEAQEVMYSATQVYHIAMH